LTFRFCFGFFSVSTVFFFFGGGVALSLVGSIAIHSIPLPAGTVLVGHCGTLVVTLIL